jgi:carbonic anhydrase
MMRREIRVRIPVAILFIASACVAMGSTALAQKHASGAVPLTPAAAFRMLVAAHTSYTRTNRSIANCFSCARDTTDTTQHPYAGVLACMDSRATPEFIFNAAPGQLFVYRDAGNVADSVIVAGMEYAVVVKKVSILVVMGHTNCGAIAGACDSNAQPAPPPLLNALLVSLRPAIRRTAASGMPSHNCNRPFLDSASSTNVLMTIEKIMALSPTLRDRVNANTLAIVGCRFDVATGKLEWLTPPPKQ